MYACTSLKINHQLRKQTTDEPVYGDKKAQAKITENPWDEAIRGISRAWAFCTET